MLPKGWSLATIEEIIGADGFVVDGDWIESKDQNISGDVRLIQLADIGDGYFKDKSSRFMHYSKAVYLNCTFLQQGDILIARMPDPLGRATIFPYDGENKYVTVVDIAIVRIQGGVLNKYLLHLLNSPLIRRQILNKQTGTTRKRISRANLSTIHLPIAPLNEQHKIVEQIELFLSRIDQVKMTLNNLVSKIDSYWTALLNNSFIVPNMKFKELDNCTIFIGAGSTPKGGQNIYEEKGIPFIRSQNVQNHYLNLDNVVYISDEIAIKMKRTKIESRDILLNITGASIGRCSEVNEVVVGGNVNQHVCIIRTDDQLSPKYLSLYLNSSNVQQLIKDYSSGATRESITLSQIKSLPIPVCSIDEQFNTVSELESQYSIIENAKNEIEKNITQLDILQNIILEKAFKGELVPQDINDEPASIFLGKINSEKLQVQHRKKRTSKNNNSKTMEKSKSAYELLRDAEEPISTNDLWLNSKHHDDIEAFYAEMKTISDFIIESENKLFLSFKDVKDENI